MNATKPVNTIEAMAGTRSPTKPIAPIASHARNPGNATKLAFACLVLACACPAPGSAAVLNLATLSCTQYQNEVLAQNPAQPTADPINTVMWLFGFAVARSGAHVMYGDALASFGFALDAECKDHPTEKLRDALTIVKPKSNKPMDLAALTCADFGARHVELSHSDRESATTIMMWLFGYAVGKNGGQVLDFGASDAFEASLLAQCAKQPGGSLYDALAAVKIPK